MDNKYFNEDHVLEVARQLQNASALYDNLFTSLSLQIYQNIARLTAHDEIVEACLQETESAITLFQKHIPHTSRIACQKGCSHCCYFPVTSPPQFIGIIAKKLKEEFSKDDLNSLKKEMQKYITSREDPTSRLKCPFLRESNTCNIYDHRPLACRSFTSADSRECFASLSDNRNIPQDPVLHRIYQAATTALMKAADRHGESSHQQDFIPTLLARMSDDAYY